MSLFQAIILGVVQGLTEFLPISSSGHLVLVPWLLGWPYPGLTFDVALHLGTLVSLLAYFWRDWLVYIKAVLGSIQQRSIHNTDAKVAWILAVATIPAAVIGKIGSEWFEHSARQPVLIGIMLIVAAIILFMADHFGRKQYRLEEIGWYRGLIVGFAQALALLPGVSRSGSTITAGLAVGLNRESAARFAFLLAVPITFGAILFKFIEVVQAGLPADEQIAFAAGILASGVTGFLAIKWMLGYVQKRSLNIFVVYRLIVGILVLAMALLM